MKLLFQVFTLAFLAFSAVAEATPYTDAAAKSVAKAAPHLAGLTAIAWSDLEHPELVSFSGTGQHATAVFAAGRTTSLGDVVVENYLTMDADDFAAAVEKQLDRLLEKEIRRQSGNGGNPPPPPPPPAGGGTTAPDVAVDAAAAEQNPYTAAADAAIQHAHARLPKLQSIAFSELEHPERVSFSGTGQHAAAVFTDGTTRDLGDVVVENYLTMEPVAFATVVYRQLAKALDNLR